MDLSTLELKFLLRLLEHPPSYRTPISKVKPNSGTKASERDRICRDLCSKGLVEYADEIRRYQTTSAGKNLLKLDTSTLPVTSEELKLLKVASEKSATPGQVSAIPAGDRQRLLHQLEERGLISSEKQIKEVWPTQQGKLYLRDDYVPTGTPTLSLSMLGSYLKFLRQFITRADGPGADNIASSSQAKPDGEALSTDIPPSLAASALTPDSVLETIRQLDQQLGTDNYLPIFYLREKLQPALTRESLDQILDELQRSDLIELGTIQHGSDYDENQLAAGISQDIGGALFFISVL